MRPIFVQDLVEPEADVLALVWKRIVSLDEAASADFFSGMECSGT
jgi:hypothetical protein